jgi:4-methyl-5(b-hydroxyethyl)-thiazole monophosphate biosynthesis
MASVLVPISNGFEEIEAVALIDVMRRGGIEVVSASLEDDREVHGANGITIIANTSIDNVKSEDFDMIVLPGGHDNAVHLKEDERVQKLIKEFDAKGKRVGAICAAPMALAEAGVIKNRYTCYPSYEEQIGKEKWSDAQNVIIDANVITSRGPGTAICFALTIVRELVGEETYSQLKSGLLADYC